MIVNMSKGSAGKILLRFSVPMLISTLFQQMYNIADSIVAGKFAGLQALAAVGASYPITMIFIAIASGFSIGATVVVSRLFGAEQTGKMKTCIFTATITSVTVAGVLTAAGLIFCRAMLTALKTEEAIMNDSVLYMSIYCWGLVFLFLYNIVNGIFTAMGDSRTPLIFLIISSLSNIFLDVLFVRSFNMGVAGVAWATFICQTVCSLLAAGVLIIRIKSIPSNEKFRLFSWKMLGTVSKIAVPSILQQSFVSVGNLFIQSLVNSFGVAATGGYSAAVKLNTLAVSSFSTMSSSVSSFTSQNVGARQYSRVKKGFSYGSLIICCTALIFSAVFLAFPNALLGFFLDPGITENTEAIKIGTSFLGIVAPFYPFVCIKLIGDGVLRGTDNMNGFMFATFSDLILRVILAYILSAPYGTNGIWYSWPAGWIIATVISVSLYFAGKWRKLKDGDEFYKKV